MSVFAYFKYGSSFLKASWISNLCFSFSILEITWDWFCWYFNNQSQTFIINWHNLGTQEKRSGAIWQNHPEIWFDIFFIDSLRQEGQKKNWNLLHPATGHCNRVIISSFDFYESLKGFSASRLSPFHSTKGRKRCERTRLEEFNILNIFLFPVRFADVG